MHGTPALQGAYFRARVRGTEVETDGQAEALLGHQIAYPDGVPAGTWLAWRWDGEALTLTRDRSGALPLFYAASADGIVVSPSITRVLASGVSRTLDLDAVATFAAIGYYLGADTPFRDIRALTSGQALTWRPGRLDVTGRPPVYEMRPMTRAEILEGFIETTRVAVARCVAAGGGPDWAMPISGGRDSRHLLYELIRQGHPPSLCVTAGHYPGIGGREDRRKAAKLCAALGIAHRGLGVPRSLVRAEQRKNMITGPLTDEHAWSLPVADALAGRTDHTYEGTPGGTVMDRPWELDGWGELGRLGRLDEAAERIALGKAGRETGRDRYSELISPAMREPLRFERAVARVRRELAVHEREPDPVLSFRVWGRAVRELALVPTLVWSDIPTVYTPYFDPDFMAFGMSVPMTAFGRELHDEAIASILPDVPPIPYARFGRPVMPRPLARMVNRDLARLLMRASDGTLLDRRRLLRMTLAGSLTGDPTLAVGRSPSLITYLVHLEELVREGPRPSA
jgi:hypothetical protein